MNCEDIAVSLFVIALDGARALIVVDGWAQERTLVALSSENGISARPRICGNGRGVSMYLRSSLVCMRPIGIMYCIMMARRRRTDSRR